MIVVPLIGILQQDFVDSLEEWVDEDFPPSTDNHASIQYIASLRSLIAAAIYSSDCHESLFKCESGQDDGKNAFEYLQQYYAALVILRDRINSLSDSIYPRFPALWNCTLYTDPSSLKQPSRMLAEPPKDEGFIYEMICVLWNLAASESYLARLQTTKAQEERAKPDPKAKALAMQHFTQANDHYCASAGLFKEMLELLGYRVYAGDAEASRLNFELLQQVMLAQGQTCMYHKAVLRTPKMHSVLAKLCVGAAELYGKIGNEYVKGQQAAWRARAEHHKAFEAIHAKKYGPAIARYEASKAKLTKALKLLKQVHESDLTCFVIRSQELRDLEQLSSIIHEEHDELLQDNESTYHAEIPAYKLLSDPLRSVIISKPTQMVFPSSSPLLQTLASSNNRKTSGDPMVASSAAITSSGTSTLEYKSNMPPIPPSQSSLATSSPGLDLSSNSQKNPLEETHFSDLKPSYPNLQQMFQRFVKDVKEASKGFSELVASTQDAQRWWQQHEDLPQQLEAFKEKQSNSSQKESSNVKEELNEDLGSLLPMRTWNAVYALQQNSTLDQVAMQLWQLKDMADATRSLLRQIDSCLKENTMMDREFRREYTDFPGQSADQMLSRVQEEFDHWANLLEDAKRGDSTLFELLDKLESEPKFKLLRMSKQDIEALVPRRDQDRLRNCLQRKRHLRAAYHSLEATSNYDVTLLQKLVDEWLKLVLHQDAMYEKIQRYCDEKYTQTVETKLVSLSANGTSFSSRNSRRFLTNEIDGISSEKKFDSNTDSNKVSRFLEEELDGLLHTKEEVEKNVQSLLAVYDKLVKEQINFVNAQERRRIKDPHSDQEDAEMDRAMIRWDNIVQNIDEATLQIHTTAEQINDGQTFYKSILPRLEDLLSNIQDLSTSLTIARCEFEEQERVKLDQNHLFLSDERAAAQLAREMEEADWRREAEDALLATDLARNPTQGETSQDFGINGTGHGGYMGSFPAMVVHHSSALTPCSTLGDPISEQQPQHSMTFLNSNPQFGGSGSDRPNLMSRSDRFISDLTMPTVSQGSGGDAQFAQYSSQRFLQPTLSSRLNRVPPSNVPGVYQVSNHEPTPTRVDDSLVAELVAMGFDPNAAFEALARHSNILEQALNDLLAS